MTVELKVGVALAGVAIPPVGLALGVAIPPVGLALAVALGAMSMVPVGLAVAEGDDTAVAVTVVEVALGDAVGRSGVAVNDSQPSSDAPTALTNSATRTSPSPSLSATGHAASSDSPRLMRTCRTSSEIDTEPSPLQSPGHDGSPAAPEDANHPNIIAAIATNLPTLPPLRTVHPSTGDPSRILVATPLEQNARIASESCDHRVPERSSPTGRFSKRPTERKADGSQPSAEKLKPPARATLTLVVRFLTLRAR